MVGVLKGALKELMSSPMLSGSELLGADILTIMTCLSGLFMPVFQIELFKALLTLTMNESVYL